MGAKTSVAFMFLFSVGNETGIFLHAIWECKSLPILGESTRIHKEVDEFDGTCIAKTMSTGYQTV